MIDKPKYKPTSGLIPLLLGILLLLPGEGFSATSPDPDLSGSFTLPAVVPSIVVRQQEVALDIGRLLDSSVESVQFELFADVSITAVPAKRSITADGSLVWQGVISDRPSAAVLFVINDGSISGEITTPETRYHIRTTADGIHIVQEVGRTAPALLNSMTLFGVTDDVIVLTNEERAKYGLYPLVYDSQLTQAAQGHADDMALNNYYDHYSLDGRDYSDRITEAGYVWNVVAENIVNVYSDAASAVNSWINSTGHHANMLSTSVCDIGVGYAYNAASYYGHYWVQDFGRRSGVTTCPVAPVGKPPDVVTGLATQLGGGKVRLTGTVNPNGLDTACFFQVGLTTAYGYTSPILNAGAGTVPLFVEFAPSGFVPATTYHYRLAARNSSGVAYGQDKTFTTGGKLPVGILNLLLGRKTYPDITCPDIPNGDFEGGNTVWIEGSYHHWIIVDNVVLDEYGLAPHSGSYAARFGGVNKADDFIQQEVTVSASCPFLTFYHWISSSDLCGFDYGYVRINGVNRGAYELCAAGNTGGWVRRTIDLSAYAGQNIALKFHAVTDGILSSLWFVDDISFRAEP